MKSWVFEMVGNESPLYFWVSHCWQVSPSWPPLVPVFGNDWTFAMPSTTKEQRKGSKPPKHWTQNIQDSTVDRAEDGKIHFSVKGGAENGQFIFVSDIKHDKIVIRSGKVHVDEILLEVNGTKVAGFTLWDIYTLFHEYSDQLLYLKCVKAGKKLFGYGIFSKD